MQHILLHWFIQLQKIQITYKLHITNTKEKEEILVKKLTFRIFHFSPYFANEVLSILVILTVYQNLAACYETNYE